MKSKKWLKGMALFFITVSFTLLVVETSFRFQWFDFYKSELYGLNPREALISDKPNVLVCGDSFSADLNGYVEMLRDSLNSFDIINAAVSGTGIRQHQIIMTKRIHQYKPDIFIYQFYIGNDLFDIRHPVKGKNISLWRKLYWSVSDMVLSVQYANFRLAGMRYKFFDDTGGSYNPKKNDKYSPDSYSKREKLNYSCEPALIENTLFLKNRRKNDLLKFKKGFKAIADMLPEGIIRYLVIIPHQSMISERWYQRHQEMGGDFKQPVYSISETEFPIYTELFELARENGFTVISPLQEFRTMKDSIPIYYENDPHLAIEGHKVLSKLLYNKLIDGKGK